MATDRVQGWFARLLECEDDEGCEEGFVNSGGEKNGATCLCIMAVAMLSSSRLPFMFPDCALPLPSANTLVVRVAHIP